jgi:hypothetical protein
MIAPASAMAARRAREEPLPLRAVGRWADPSRERSQHRKRLRGPLQQFAIASDRGLPGPAGESASGPPGWRCAGGCGVGNDVSKDPVRMYRPSNLLREYTGNSIAKRIASPVCFSFLLCSFYDLRFSAILFCRAAVCRTKGEHMPTPRIAQHKEIPETSLRHNLTCMIKE